MEARCRIRVRRKLLFGGAAVAALAGSVFAQPVEIVNTNQAMLTVPATITYKAVSGTNTLDTAEIGPFPAAETLERRPKTVPVFTMDEVTELLTAGAVIAEGKELPLKVVIQANGDYELVVQSAIAEVTVSEIPITYVVAPLPGTFERVPERVIVDTANNNDMTAELTAIGPVTGDKTLVRPKKVKVFSRDANDIETAGVTMRNDTLEPVFSLVARVPGWVEMDAGGNFSVHPIWMDKEAFALDPADALYPAGYADPSPVTIETKVVYTPAVYELRDPIHQRGPFNLNYNLIAPELGEEETAKIRLSLDLATSYFMSLFAGTEADIQVNVVTGTLQPNTIANCSTPSDENTYTSVRQAYQFYAALEEFFDPEIDVYDALPSGSSVNYERTAFGPQAESALRVPSAILSKWYNHNAANEAVDFVLTINTSHIPTLLLSPLDPNPLGETDLFYIILHESLHGFGFSSGTGQHGGFPRPAPRLWDLFRFPHAVVGDVVGQGEFFSTYRTIRSSTEAISATGFLIGDSYRMSTGDLVIGHSASHWLDFALLALPECIGIMDPHYGCGTGPIGMLYESDVKAMDILGYVVDLNNTPVTPDPCSLLLPLPGTIDTLTPICSWEPSPQGYYSHFSVARMTHTGEYEVVYQQLNIEPPTGTATVPAGVLSAATEYTWYVVTQNDAGMRHSEYRTFVTPGVACSADFDNDDVVNVADIFAFLSAWFAQGPGSDFNNDAAINVVDIFAFLSAWFAGCP